MRNKENVRLVDASTKVLEMLNIVETLTTQFEHQIIPEDVVSVFNCVNTIRFMAQIILYNLVVKGLIQQELLLQKPRENTSYLILHTIIVSLEEEAKSQAALQEWSYWVR
ncbi:16486_t:CDS:2, partial [Dentiscutata erythropus]